MKNFRILFLYVLLFLIFVSSKTFSQTQTFPDGLSIVCKYDFADTLSSSRPLGRKYNHVTSHNGKYILYANYRCGVVDAAGNTIIPEANQLIIRNSDVFEVRNKDRHGLIDTKGLIIGEYDYLTKISDQLYRARKNKKLGIIDIQGNEIIPIEYEYIGNITDNKTIQIRKGNKHGIVNEQGNIIIPCEYDYILKVNSYYIVRKGDKRGVIDFYGKTIIPCEYDFVVNDIDLFRVRKGDKWGAINFDGKMIIPLEYDYLNVFENGVSKGNKNGYIGYINKNNQVIIDFKYAYINPFVNGVAETCECEEFVQARNQKMVKQYEKLGYVLLKTPTRIMAMGKNPIYSELNIETLINQ
jgi:hypothetical protein